MKRINARQVEGLTASASEFTPTGTLSSDNVQDALNELDAEKETTAGAQARADAAESAANAYTDTQIALVSGNAGGGGGTNLLVLDGVVPLEPVGMDGAPDEWLYSDGASGTGGGGGGVTDHGALTGLADDDHPQYVKGKSGRSYRMVAGVLRKTSGTWALLSDSGHAPVGLGTVTANSTGIVITLDPVATRIGSVTVTPDETYAGSYTAGASVGLSTITIYVYDLAGTQLNPTTMPDSTSGNFWILGIVEAS